MGRNRTESSIVMQLLGGSLVAPLQGEISDAAMDQIQSDILDRISSDGVKGLILDLSGIATIDSFLAQSIIETEKMASLLGSTTVWVGLRADSVAALIHLEIDLRGVKTALNLDMAQDILKPFVATKRAFSLDDEEEHFFALEESPDEKNPEEEEDMALFEGFEREDDNAEHLAEDFA